MYPSMMQTLLNTVRLGQVRRRPVLQPRYLSLVDFGSYHIKTAVVRREEAGVRILGYGIVPARGCGLRSGRNSLAALVEVTDQALMAAEDQTASDNRGKIVPDDAVFGVPTCLTRGQLFSVRQTRPDLSVPVAAREVKNLWERAERMAREQLSRRGKEGEGGAWRPLALTPGVMLLDGHQVTDPVGMRGRVLALSVFGVAVRPSVLRTIEEIARRLEVGLVDVVAGVQSLAALVPQRDAILVDVGYQGTSLCLIRSGSLVATRWWAQGGHFFTEALARAFRCAPEDAEGLKRAYAQRSLSSSDEQLVARALAAPLSAWFESLIDELANMAEATEVAHQVPTLEYDMDDTLPYQHDNALPSHIYLTGGGSWLPGLSTTLASIEGVPSLKFRRALEVEALGHCLGMHLPGRPLLLDVPAYPLSDLIATTLSLVTCVG